MDEPLRIVEQLVPIGSDGVNEFLRKWLLRSITILRSRSIKDYRASFFFILVRFVAKKNPKYYVMLSSERV